MLLPTLVLLCAFVSYTSTAQIANGVDGTPTVRCAADTVTVDLRTLAPFAGNIFVKDKSTDPSCVRKFPNNKGSHVVYTIPLGQCGMKRLRQVNPRGINFEITVIVSFHKLFVTSVDKAYSVRCFYMEPEEAVSARLNVSLLPTSPLYESMKMPSCEYSVRKDSPNGPVATYANIGDRVYHVWQCDGSEMGMMVKKCFATNGRGEEVAIVDYDGCSNDEVLLDQLTYDTTLMRAHAASRVFKYADTNELHFNCQIRLCQKSAGSCDGVTPPVCTGIPLLRGRRALPSVAAESPLSQHWFDASQPDELDVATDDLFVAELHRKLTKDWRAADGSEDGAEDGSILSQSVCLNLASVYTLTFFVLILCTLILLFCVSGSHTLKPFSAIFCTSKVI